MLVPTRTSRSAAAKSVGRPSPVSQTAPAADASVAVTTALESADVLHTIGGDDTNTAAADLAAYLRSQGSELTVVGLPKTIDNDIVPIKQSLGAITAVNQSARNGTYLREKTLAHWVAMNLITERRLQPSPPDVAETSGEVEFANARWRWTLRVTQTEEHLGALIEDSRS